MNNVKNFVKHIVYGYKASSSAYIKKLRSMGASIGEDVTIHFPGRTVIDASDPHLLTIGNHVNITGPATILTHDYSWSVIKGKTGEILGNEKSVTIGNNVFIGWGATILCGTTIEDNVIIGAHAVVSGRVRCDSVWGGVPAKFICTLEQYRVKRQSAQLEEAKQFVRAFRLRYGRDPEASEVSEYFFLFADADNLCEKYESQIGLMGTREKSLEILSHPRPYPDLYSFLNDC